MDRTLCKDIVDELVVGACGKLIKRESDVKKMKCFGLGVWLSRTLAYYALGPGFNHKQHE
jgi:hypothetical protein